MEGEADVEVAEEVPRVPVEGFRPREEPHVQLVAARALGRPRRERHVHLIAARALGRRRRERRDPRPLGRAKAVAKRLPLDLQEVARPLHKVGPAPVAALSDKVPRLDSAQRPVAERRIALPGAAQPLVSLIISSTFLVPQPAPSELRARDEQAAQWLRDEPAAQRVRHEPAAQRPISCKAGEDNSRRELSAVPP